MRRMTASFRRILSHGSLGRLGAAGASRLLAGLAALLLGMSIAASQETAPAGWVAGPEEDAVIEVGQRFDCTGARCPTELSCLYALGPTRPPGSWPIDTGFMLEHGKRNAEEISLLVKGGLSSMEALVAATSAAADAIEVEAGRLAPGLYADIVFVAGDPLADITVLEDASKLEVFKGGRAVAGAAAV